MDKHVEAPFYLSNPSRTRFAPTTFSPLTLGQQVNAFRTDLLEELEDSRLPNRKKEQSLEYFLGGKHDMNEILRDFELGQRALKNSSDDCGLGSTLEKMKSCPVSKMLIPLDKFQMKAFTLMEATPELPVFPVELQAEIELKYKKKRKEERKQRKKDKERKKEKATSSLESSSQESCALSQEKLQALTKPPAAAALVAPSKPTRGRRSIISNRGKFSGNSGKKSVVAALKDVRAPARGRRGRPARSLGKIGLHHRNVHAVPAMAQRRGRGRPRKIPLAVAEVKKIQLPPREVLPSPPSKALPELKEEATIKMFSGLKMTLKLGGSDVTEGTTSGIGKEDYTLVPTEPKQDKLVCRIRLPKGNQSNEENAKDTQISDEDDHLRDI